MKVMKKSIVLDAEFATEDGEIETPEGVMKYHKGDVIITGINGEKYPVRHDIFISSYDILESEDDVK